MGCGFIQYRASIGYYQGGMIGALLYFNHNKKLKCLEETKRLNTRIWFLYVLLITSWLPNLILLCRVLLCLPFIYVVTWSWLTFMRKLLISLLLKLLKYVRKYTVVIRKDKCVLLLNS